MTDAILAALPAPSGRPLLVLDLDGVLNLFGAYTASTTVIVSTDGHEVRRLHFTPAAAPLLDAVTVAGHIDDVRSRKHSRLGLRSSVATTPGLSAAIADGTVAATTETLVRTADGQKFVITFREDVVDALHALVASGAVEFGWLTTWGPNARAVVEQAFSGRLAGGYVLAKKPKKLRGYRNPDWKRHALENRVAELGTRWVWAEDEEVPRARADGSLDDDTLAGIPGLAFGTDESVGLTPADVARATAFLLG